MEGFFTCQKNESTFKALQGQKALMCSEQKQNSQSSSQTFKEKLCTRAPWGRPFAPAMASHTILLWPGLDFRFWLWIYLCFHDNQALFELCLLCGCYIWIHRWYPALRFLLVMISEAQFQSGPPHTWFPASFNLSLLPLYSCHIQSPASGSRYRLPTSQFQHGSAGHIFHMRWWRSSRFPVSLGGGKYSH